MKLMACAVMAMPLVAGTAAQAGEWRAVVIDEEVGVVVDTSTIRNLPYGRKKVAWFAQLLPTTNEFGADYMMIQNELDCSAMTVTQLSFHAYGSDAKSLGSLNERLAPEPVIPDTRGHAMHRSVCEGIDNPPAETVGEALKVYREVLAGGN